MMRLSNCIVLAVASFIILCPQSWASQAQIIIDYADDKSGKPGFAQPLYFMYNEQEKLSQSDESLSPINYTFDYCDDNKFHKTLKCFQNATYIKHVPTIGNNRFITYYLRAEDDMHPEGSPSQYLLRKDSYLKVVLELDRTIVEDNMLNFAVPNGYYFTSDFSDINDESIKQSTFKICDILLQKAVKLGINNLTKKLTHQELIRIIDWTKTKQRTVKFNQCFIIN